MLRYAHFQKPRGIRVGANPAGRRERTPVHLGAAFNSAPHFGDEDIAQSRGHVEPKLEVLLARPDSFHFSCPRHPGETQGHASGSA